MSYNLSLCTKARFLLEKEKLYQDALILAEEAEKKALDTRKRAEEALEEFRKAQEDLQSVPSPEQEPFLPVLEEVLMAQAVEELSGNEVARQACRAAAPFNMCKCAARIWNAGLGGQCTRSHLDGERFCKTHLNKYNSLKVKGLDLAFGYYDGERPTHDQLAPPRPLPWKN